MEGCGDNEQSSNVEVIASFSVSDVTDCTGIITNIVTLEILTRSVYFFILTKYILIKNNFSVQTYLYEVIILSPYHLLISLMGLHQNMMTFLF